MEPIKRNLATPMPEDILFLIFQDLPVESLLRFKCVSKRWCSMIEDPHFVDAFRIRPHNRGTRLLVCKSLWQDRYSAKVTDCFVLDSEGKSVPLDVPIILQEGHFPIRQPVEGLICFDDATIWNPTTKKITHIPLRNPFPDATKTGMGIPAGECNCSFQSDCLLGFDVATKNYKVLRICKAQYYRKTPVDAFTNGSRVSENKVHAEILTLGAHCWKNTNYPPPQELSKGFWIMDCCSIKGIMYIIISPKYKGRCLISPFEEVLLLLLTFDLSQEKFQLLPLPSGLNHVQFAGEVGGRFTLIYGYQIRKIWILEEEQEFEGGKWTVVDLLLPQSWNVEDYTWEDDQVWIDPIGSNQSGEILLEVCKEDEPDNAEDESDNVESLSAIFSYNLERKDVRMVKTLTALGDDYITILPKFVENVHPLK